MTRRYLTHNHTTFKTRVIVCLCLWSLGYIVFLYFIVTERFETSPQIIRLTEGIVTHASGGVKNTEKNGNIFRSKIVDSQNKQKPNIMSTSFFHQFPPLLKNNLLYEKPTQHLPKNHIGILLRRLRSTEQTNREPIQWIEDSQTNRMQLKTKKSISSSIAYTNDRDMFTLHMKSCQKFTDDEIIEYFQREKLSESRFSSRVLDLNNDRLLLKTLFPSQTSSSEIKDRITDQLRVRLNVSKPKIIFSNKRNSVNNGKKFADDNCNVKQCIFTSDVNDIDRADVFLDERRYSPTLPKPGQLHIVYMLESAANYPHLVLSQRHPVNWTATYRHDSILPTPYGRFVPYLNVTRLPKTPGRNFAQNKKRLAAWFVSNCVAQNNRLEYVHQLQRDIEVDIFGACGDLKCDTHSTNCQSMLKKTYKFYLSFENSNCKDYVTEKLFTNAFENDIIPVVMGAHREEYKRIAPPNSYIHVDDFKSPKQLAQYLKFLDKNDDAYNEYFLWKNTGRFVNTKFMCRLCAMVHLAPLFPMWYETPNSWWSRKGICQ